LQTIIQEAFQHQLNAIAPTASSHGYAAEPFHQNAFGALEANDTDEESIDRSVAMQVVGDLPEPTDSQYGCKHKRAPRTIAGTPRGTTKYDAQKYASNHCCSQCSDIQPK
jgi:hypothetical protein